MTNSRAAYDRVRGSSELSVTPSNSHSLSLGLDVGATKTHGVVLDANDQILADHVQPTRKTEEGIRTTILDVSTRLARQLGVSVSAFTSVGIGIPGIVRHPTGMVENAVNLGIGRMNLIDLVAAGFAAPVRVENDVKASALGARLALGGQIHDLCYVNLGTGVATAAVSNGRLLRGGRNGAGEIGHLAVYPDGELCGCGQRGCLETEAGGNHIMRRLSAQGLDLTALDTDPSPAALVEKRRITSAVVTALTLVAITYDSVKVVVGGGVPRAARWLVPAVSAELRRRACESSFLAGLAVADRIAQIPDEIPAPAIGAAMVGAGR